MELYMDEKWKLCKRGSRRSGAEGGGGEAFLKGSVGMREGRRGSGGGVGGAGACTSFSSRCASLVKEQRARFYIMRRCVTMLICWKDYS